MTRKLLLVIFILSLGFFSCNKVAQPMSKAEVSKKIDSAVKASVMESDQAARLDLERRIKIEVKVKVDSLVNAHMEKAFKDTAAKKKSAVK